MRKRMIVLGGAIAALALVVSVASFAAARSEGTGELRSGGLRLVERLSGATPIDLPPTGESAGDEVVFDNPVYDRANSGRVGTSRGACTQVGADATVYHCVSTLVLGEHQIALQGVVDFSQKTRTIAVSGGTGKYRRARGQVSFTQTSPTTNELKIELK